MEESREYQKVIFKTKNGRIRSGNLEQLCKVFNEFHSNLDRKDPSSYRYIPLIKNYEKAIRVLTFNKPELVRDLLSVEVEPEGDFEHEFLNEPTLVIKFPRELKTKISKEMVK